VLFVRHLRLLDVCERWRRHAGRAKTGQGSWNTTGEAGVRRNRFCWSAVKRSGEKIGGAARP
jgi:hypothetical protein